MTYLEAKLKGDNQIEK